MERGKGRRRGGKGMGRRGGKDRGRDLLDQCQTTSYSSVGDCKGSTYSYTLLS